MKVGPGKWLGVRTLVEQAGGFGFRSPVPMKKLSTTMQPRALELFGGRDGRITGSSLEKSGELQVR